MPRIIAPILAAALALVVVLAPTLAQSAGFTETFDSPTPAAPQPYQNPHNWDIMTFGVDPREPSVAQHGPNCEPPGFPYNATNSHPIHSAADAVFICGAGANTHLMTSPGISGYGAIYMTPPAVADFSGGQASIQWDMSTLRTSSRDWIYVVLTPFSEHHEMAYINTDQHIPTHNIKIALGGTNTFEIFQNGGFQNSRLDGTDLGTTWDQVFQAQTPPIGESGARRDTFQITLDRNHISLCMPGYQYRGQPFCWAKNVSLHETLDPAVWGDQAAVQFTHVVYNAEKGCEDAAIAAGYQDGKGQPNSTLDQFDIVHNSYGDANCPPNTWHWDSFSVNPAVPYSVIPSNPEALSFNTPRATRVNFAVPAPANSFLSFTSWGDTPQLAVSFDGVNWQAPRLQPATSLAHPEVGEQVFMPIPEGQQSVMVRGAPGYWGTFEASSFKVIVPPGGALVQIPDQPTPQSQPTSTPPVPPTQTSTPRPTQTSQATPTSTVQAKPSLTPTPMPTVAPTAVPDATETCMVQVWINGVPRAPVAC